MNGSDGQDPGEATAENHPVIASLTRDVSLGGGARQGAAWLGGSRVAVQAMQFLVSVATARLLLPSEFGEAAFALAIVNFAQIFANLGLASAIVHARRATSEMLTTAFYVNVGAALALGILTAALAYPISLLFGGSSLFVLLLIASGNFAVTRGAVQTAILERTFNYRTLAIIEAGGYGSGIILVPVFALMGFGASSLVLGPLIGTLILSCSLWLAVPWRPEGRPTRAAVSSLWAYSRGLVGFNAIGYWAVNLDTLSLGVTATSTDVGYYNRAFNLMMVPVHQMSMVLGRVLFPSLARLRDQPARLGQAWLRSLEVAATLSMPITVTFAAAAPSLVAVLYGSRWEGTVPILQLLALSAVPQVLAGSTGAVFRALGLNDLLFKVGLVSTLLSVIAIVAGLHWGAVGVAAALLVRHWVGLPVVFAPLFRATGLRVRDLARPAYLVLVPAVALGAAQLAVRWAAADHFEPIMVLALQLAAGGALYLVALKAIGSPVLPMIARGASRVTSRLG